jgi:hypothetical protein
MGDMADDFRFMKEEALKVRAAKEPTRFEYATDALMAAGHTVGLDPANDKCLVVNGTIKLYPYKGWWSGKGVGSGRGVDNLIKQLTPNQPKRK